MTALRFSVLSMRLLITGGAGFQGSATVARLSREHELAVLNTPSERARAVAENMPRVEVIWGSVTDTEVVQKAVADRDAVLHLAARVNVDESIADPASHLAVNTFGTLNVLDSVRKHGCRMLHVSSCEVYGSPLLPGLIEENAEFRPHSPYAASKAAADRLCFAYYKTYGTRVTILRPFNVYGEGQRDGKTGAVIAIFARRAIAGEPLVVFGDGSQSRDFIHIDDVVRAYELVLEQEGLDGEAINFGTGEATTIAEIAQRFSSRAGVPIEHAARRPGEVPTFIGANGAKARTIGFSPSVPFAGGLARYMDWRGVPGGAL